MSVDSFQLLFSRARTGDSHARNAFYALVYPRLRSIAAALMRHERPGHTLQPTALVGELFVKLNRLQTRMLGEEHFFGLSARAMRQVLIDYGRARRTRPTPADTVLEMLSSSTGEAETQVAVRVAYDKLAALDPLAASTVWLLAIEGLTLNEVALAQSRKLWRVRADYEFGLDWMGRHLSTGGCQQDSSKQIGP